MVSLLRDNMNVKGVAMLSTAIIKIISKLYNHSISTNECLKLSESKNYTNELNNNPYISRRKIEKFFAFYFYKNGPIAKEDDYLANYLINKYNDEIRSDNIFYN